MPPATRLDRRRQSDSQVAELLAFERVLAELIAVFVDLPADRVAYEIEVTLKRLLDFLGFDRCGFAEISGVGSAVTILYSVAVNGVQPVPLGPFPAQLDWYMKMMRAGQTLVLASVPDDLPPDAVGERAYVEAIGMRSHVSIPLRVAGRLFGAIGFAAFRTTRMLPAELVGRIKTIGDVLAAALVRSRVEAELAQTRTDLWHADRVASAGALTGSIAHELNQPLAAILSNAQAALRFLDSGVADQAEIRAILQAIVREDKRAGAVIRGLRALLSHEKTQRNPIDLGDTIDEVLLLLGAALDADGIQVEKRFQQGCIVLADKTQLQQVAVNLINNAMDAMRPLPRGARKLRIVISRTDMRGGAPEATVTVRDSGIGIDSSRLASIFAPFSTSKAQGMGLGLAIVRAIVEAHDGVINAEAQSDGGVAFTLSLPTYRDAAEQVAETPAADHTAPYTSGARNGSVAKIWVVDDDPSILQSLACLLSATGFAVETFGSATEFLNRSHTTEAACLLLDACMPGMTGPELQSRLREQGSTVPVVFLTGDSDVHSGIEAMKLGALDYLLKPVDDEMLLRTVGRAVQSHLARQMALEVRHALEQRVHRLSPRERDVMDCVVRGQLNKQIAAELGISEKTVKQHRGRVMEKMEARSVADLVRLCDAMASLSASRGRTRATAPAHAGRMLEATARTGD